MTWQPIETAPKDGTHILAWDRTCIECIFFNKDVGKWVTTWDCDESYEFLGMPTHWMPLPPPPESEQTPIKMKPQPEPLIREKRLLAEYEPQPPVAAPLELPEPVAYLHECGKKPSLRTLEFSKVVIKLSAKGYKSLPLYTEQQVMDLLKSHGISVKTSK